MSIAYCIFLIITSLVIPTTYWGTGAWWKQALADEAVIEVMESFPKQTLRNRCVIVDPMGREVVLSVPVCKVEHKQLTRDVLISYQQHWQHQHWNAILSAYKKTPYFDYYQDFIRPLYEREFRYLLDLNDATCAVAEALLNNRMPDAKKQFILPKTTDWANADTEANWGDNISILDLLFRIGPMALSAK